MSDGTVRIAAIDIGSDTVHLLIADATRHADGIRLTRVDQEGELLLLGDAVARDGKVGVHAGQLESTLVKLAERARTHAGRTLVGATEALRAASDGQALVDRLAARIGLPIRILTGAREAGLGLLGAGFRLDPTGPQLLIDSGGASTELTLTDGRRRVASASLPVGAAQLGATLRGDPPEPLSWALGGTRIGVALASAPAGTPIRAWATGGSAHNLVGLERPGGHEGGDGGRDGESEADGGREANGANGVANGARRLARSDLDRLSERLLAEPAEKLARHSGEDPRRVAILAPGLLIIAAILEHYRLAEVTVVPEGLRDGMIAAACNLGEDWWRDA